MVAVYNTEVIRDVVSLLSACKIVTLDIFLDDSLGREVAEHVLKYTLVSDYPEAEQGQIKKKINQNASYFFKARNEISEFIEMKTRKSVKGFSLSFDIRANKLKVNKVYRQSQEPKENPDDFNDLLNKLEKLVNESKKQETKLDVYNKIPNPNGKRPRYEQMTLKEAINTLKNMEM